MASRKLKIQNVTQPDTRMIAIDDIYVDLEFNVRKSYGDIDGLASSIKAEGQLTPVIVALNPQKGHHDKGPGFLLIAGFRRVAAIAQLADRPVMCLIKVFDSETDAAVLNLTENLVRQNLTTYETAMGCRTLKERYGMTASQIAHRLVGDRSISSTHVSNLVRATENLEPEYLEIWAKGGDIPLKHIFKMSARTTEEQHAYYRKEILHEVPDGDGDGDGGDPPTPLPTPAKRPGQKILVAALVAAQQVEASKGKAGLVGALKFALGLTETLKVGRATIFDPSVEPETEE